MPRGPVLQLLRNAGPFTDGQLFAGELGIDVTTGDIWLSRNGVTVEKYASGGAGGAVNLSDLNDVQIASLVEGNIFSYDATAGKWINRTLTQVGAIPASQKGNADGVATLGSDGKVPTSQLPSLAVTSVTVVASQAAQLALSNQAGDVVIRTDLEGTPTYIHNGGSAGTMADYTLIQANDTAIDGTHITAGTIAAARFQGSVIAALNGAPAGTIQNPNLIIDCGTL